MMISTIICALLALCLGGANAYELVYNYDYTNWYTSFTFETVSNLTHQLLALIMLHSCQTQPMALSNTFLWPRPDLLV